MATEEIQNDTTNTTDKTVRHRSPAWPFIPLSKAIERTQEFYKAHRDRAASASAANVAWGMGAKSGAGFQTIATLKQYGLIRESDTAGLVQLTELALRIVRDQREDSPEREQALQQAALKPPIFSDLWEKWEADLPPDATVQFYLVHEKRFGEDAAKSLLANYKQSLQLAHLAEFDNVADSDDGNEVHKGAAIPPKAPKNPPPPLVRPMEGERIVFTHEIEPTHGVRVLASGEVDDSMLDALELYIQLQKKRLERENKAAKKSE
jgi:hypothetical protein